MKRALLMLALAACSEHGSQGPDVVNIDAGGDPTDDALARYSSCMTLEDFQLAGMGESWRTVQAAGAACSSCHAEGQLGFPGSLEDKEFFAAISTHRRFLTLFFTLDLATSRVVVNETAIPLLGARAEHPRFPTEPGMEATRRYFALTDGALQANGGACGPSKLID